MSNNKNITNKDLNLNNASTTYTNKTGIDKEEERKLAWDNANKVHNAREEAKKAYNSYLQKKK